MRAHVQQIIYNNVAVLDRIQQFNLVHNHHIFFISAEFYSVFINQALSLCLGCLSNFDGKGGHAPILALKSGIRLNYYVIFNFFRKFKYCLIKEHEEGREDSSKN